MIEFKNVSIGYSEELVYIEELSLELGQVYILVGRNGSGKSTLLKTITQQITPLKGELRLDGVRLNTLKNHSVSKQIAFVGSTFPIVDFLSVRDYIGLGRTPHTNALGRLTSKDEKAISYVIELIGLEHLSEKYTSDLSDGERQLASIARALAQETPIVLLDEPTAFLDYSNKLNVLSKLTEIAAELNKCIVLSSHDIDLSIEANCPFIVVPKDSKNLMLLTPPVDKKILLEKAFL